MSIFYLLYFYIEQTLSSLIENPVIESFNNDKSKNLPEIKKQYNPLKNTEYNKPKNLYNEVVEIKNPQSQDIIGENEIKFECRKLMDFTQRNLQAINSNTRVSLKDKLLRNSAKMMGRNTFTNNILYLSNKIKKINSNGSNYHYEVRYINNEQKGIDSEVQIYIKKKSQDESKQNH